MGVSFPSENPKHGSSESARKIRLRTPTPSPSPCRRKASFFKKCSNRHWFDEDESPPRPFSLPRLFRRISRKRSEPSASTPAPLVEEALTACCYSLQNIEAWPGGKGLVSDYCSVATSNGSESGKEGWAFEAISGSLSDHAGPSRGVPPLRRTFTDVSQTNPATGTIRGNHVGNVASVYDGRVDSAAASTVTSSPQLPPLCRVWCRDGWAAGSAADPATHSSQNSSLGEPDRKGKGRAIDCGTPPGSPVTGIDVVPANVQQPQAGLSLHGVWARDGFAPRRFPSLESLPLPGIYTGEECSAVADTMGKMRRRSSGLAPTSHHGGDIDAVDEVDDDLYRRENRFDRVRCRKHGEKRRKVPKVLQEFRHLAPVITAS